MGEEWRRTFTHTHMHALTVVCVCESELSVLLSHTIHHKLLILLDHCRAFRTPRCSLKTQSEANAPNPPNTHTHTQALTFSFLLAHTLTATLRGQKWSWGTPPVQLYKRCLNVIDRSCMDQVCGVKSGCGGGKTGSPNHCVTYNYNLYSKV